MTIAAARQALDGPHSGGAVEALVKGFGNGPTDWTASWVSYTFNTFTGGDVEGGVTLQLKADCGAVESCTLDVYFDNVSVIVP